MNEIVLHIDNKDCRSRNIGLVSGQGGRFAPHGQYHGQHRRTYEKSNCDKCGQPMNLLTSVPSMGRLPAQRIFVCRPCRIAISDEISASPAAR
jgi:hypothetical protein